MPGDVATAGTAGAGVTQSAAGGPQQDGQDGAVVPGAENGVTAANGARAAALRTSQLRTSQLRTSQLRTSQLRTNRPACAVRPATRPRRWARSDRSASRPGQ